MPRAAASEFDLVIIGAGPAGSSAALQACREGLRPLLLDREKFPRAIACTGWIGPTGVKLCREFGLDARAAKATPFSGLRLISWDLARRTDVDDEQLSGWLVDRDAFDHALLAAARAAGATTRLGVAAERLSLGEDAAGVHLADGTIVRAKVLILADGLHSRLAAAANLTAAGSAPAVPRCAYLQIAQPNDKPGLEVIIGDQRSGQLATLVRGPKSLRLSLLVRGAGVEPESLLVPFLERAVRAGLLPAGKLPPPQVRASPAGVALDLETHVGKRCLLVGDAGGFVSAFSNEGVFPAMRSGETAARVAAAAVKARVLQDELASFSDVWRTDLADYIRMPNTDLSLLLPLVFSNAQMSRRVARAFLLGQPF